MEGSIPVYMDDEMDVIDRGLEPFRVHFCFYLLNLKVPTHLRGKVIILCCERKGHMAMIEKPVHIEPSADETQINQVLELYSTMARREKIDAEILSSHDPVINGEPIPSFETVMARITLRNENPKGAVLDCVSLNLATFISGRHSITRLELSLQLGGKLAISIDAKIVSDDLIAKKCTTTETTFVNNVDFGASEAKLNSGGSNPVVQESESNKKIGSGCNNTEIAPPTRNVSYSTESTAKSVSDTDGDGHEDDKLFSSCTTNGEQDNLTEISTRIEDKESAHQDNMQAGKPSFWREVASWSVGEEYSTQYSGGIWRETPRLSELGGSQKLVMWSIEGPSDDGNEEDDVQECSESAPKRKHNSMTISCSKPGPPARVGKLSPMQKCILAPKIPAKPTVIPLGAPISLLRSSVLAASKFLVHEFKFVDEPLLSDSDEEEEEEEDKEEEDEDEDEEDDTEREEESSDNDDKDEEEDGDNKGEKAREEDEADDGKRECDENASLSKSATPEQNMDEECLEQPDQQFSTVYSSKASKSGDSSESGESDRVGAYHDTRNENLEGEREEEEAFQGSLRGDGHEQSSEFMFQIREMEKCIFELREELRSALIENRKLRSELEKAKSENLEQDASREDIGCKDCYGNEDDKCLIGELKQQLRVERDKNVRCQLEQERLLGVILALKSELDRETTAGDLKKNIQVIEDRLEKKLRECEILGGDAHENGRSTGAEVAERTLKGKQGKNFFLWSGKG